MGRVKSWLMEIEEYAFSCLEDSDHYQKSVDWAREQFLKKYPREARLFNAVVSEYQEGPGEMLDPEWINSTTKTSYIDYE